MAVTAVTVTSLTHAPPADVDRRGRSSSSTELSVNLEPRRRPCHLTARPPRRPSLAPHADFTRLRPRHLLLQPQHVGKRLCRGQEERARRQGEERADKQQFALKTTSPPLCTAVAASLCTAVAQVSVVAGSRGGGENLNLSKILMCPRRISDIRNFIMPRPQGSGAHDTRPNYR